MMKLSTPQFAAELHARGYPITVGTAQTWATKHGIATKFGRRWLFPPVAVELLTAGIDPAEVGARLRAANQSGEAA